MVTRSTTVNQNRRPVVLLLSGGIDSTVVLHMLKNSEYEIHAVTYDYGQKHRIEIDFAASNAVASSVKSHRIIKLDNELFIKGSSLTDHELQVSTYDDNDQVIGITDVFVPSRNLMFISQATSLAETIRAEKVFVGFNSDDAANFPDCRNEFLAKLNELLAIQSSIQPPPKVVAPLIEKTKKEVVILARELGVDLSNTITCYNPIETAECEKCLSCQSKRRAINDSN